jgi:pimeloyl-ACP methyl ester carboxylesterase
MQVRKRFIEVDGIRTHYLEAGEGRPVVLLHSGEFGGCAELRWEFTLPKLAELYRVIAPDWLGFGETDKLRRWACAVDQAHAPLHRNHEGGGGRLHR